MKKAIRLLLIVISGVALLLIAGLTVIYFVADHDESAPARPPKVPPHAVWQGGPDAGYWYELVNADPKKNNYHFYIYNDYDSGILAVDAWFVQDSNSHIRLPHDTAILRKIAYFDLENIQLTNCKLYIQYPVTGGSLATIMNETKMHDTFNITK